MIPDEGIFSPVRAVNHKLKDSASRPENELKGILLKKPSGQIKLQKKIKQVKHMISLTKDK